MEDETMSLYANLFAYAKKIDTIVERREEERHEERLCFLRELNRVKRSNIVDAVLFLFWAIDVGLVSLNQGR